MTTEQEMASKVLPSDYKPFERVEICSNSFLGGQVLIMVEGHPLFLIGKGPEMQLWLKLKVSDKKWEYVVTPEEVTDSAFSVQQAGRYLALYFGDHLVLQANREADDCLIINHVDFRPLGISIFGTPKEMHVGGARLANNSFQNIHTMVSVT